MALPENRLFLHEEDGRWAFTEEPALEGNEADEEKVTNGAS